MLHRAVLYMLTDISEEIIALMMEAVAPLKRRSTSTRLHEATFQKTAIFINFFVDTLVQSRVTILKNKLSSSRNKANVAMGASCDLLKYVYTTHKQTEIHDTGS
jgi:hypothetical protein